MEHAGKTESKYPEKRARELAPQVVKEKVENNKFDEALDIVTQLGDKILKDLHRVDLQFRLEQLTKLLSERD